MIITGLRIDNFKNYLGYNEFNFGISPNKNVILVGGMNGAGKTSLSEAIRLCLYGPKMNGNMMSESKYHAYLNKMWSKDHTNEPMFIEIDVENDDSKNGIRLTIRREFEHRIAENNKVLEKLTLTKDGKDVELIDKNYWEFYIQRIIPAHVSRYFFFDGEKTRDIISSTESAEYLKTAIRDITGISKLDTLSTDLTEVKRRLLRNDIKPSVKKKINQLEDQIRSLEVESRLIQDEIKGLEDQKAAIEFDIEAQKVEYNRIVGIKNTERESTQDEIKSISAELAVISEKVYNFVYGPLLRIILHDKMAKALDAANEENLANHKAMLNEYISKKIDGLGTEMADNGFTDYEIKRVVHFIEGYLPISGATRTRSTIVDLTPSQIQDLRNQLDVGEERYAFVKHLSEREDLSLRKAKLEKDVSRYELDAGHNFDEKTSALMALLDEINELINQKIGALQVKNEDLEKARRVLMSEERSLILSDRDQESVHNIEELLKLIGMRASIASENGITKFEKSLNDTYGRLKNKDDMVKHIHINEDYVLRLEGYDGQDVDVEWISEGEKGILMYSVMYGLTSLSESKLPLIIDSPLGRMDSIHVKNLISELYPKIGSQVIILSHDREITKNTLPIIEPIISKMYLLSRKAPKVQEGYFE